MATCAISATEANVIPASGAKARDDSQTNLVKRAQAGDEQAFATLFQQHKNRVYSVCLLMTKDVAEAEDLTQEAFLQVFRTVSSFRGDAAFSTWLYRVAVNTVLMKLRRRKSPPTVSLDEPVNSGIAFAASRFRQERIRNSLASSTELPCVARCRNCLKDAARSLRCTRWKATSITRLPSCSIAPSATQNRSCTKRS